jgi:hypothetical protein
MENHLEGCLFKKVIKEVEGAWYTEDFSVDVDEKKISFSRTYLDVWLPSIYFDYCPCCGCRLIEEEN